MKTIILEFRDYCNWLFLKQIVNIEIASLINVGDIVELDGKQFIIESKKIFISDGRIIYNVKCIK